MILNLFLAAFALSSCGGKAKSTTSDSNLKNTTIGVTATDRRTSRSNGNSRLTSNVNAAKGSDKPDNDLVQDISNMNIYDAFELAEDYVEDGNYESFDELLRERVDLLDVRLTKDSSKGTTRGNNILHMIVNKSTEDNLEYFLNSIFKINKRALIKLSYLANSADQGIRPIDLKDNSRKNSVLERYVLNIFMLEDERVAAIDRGDIDFFVFALNRVKDSAFDKEFIFNSIIKDNNIQKDLLYIAFEKNNIDIFNFLVNEAKVTIDRRYFVDNMYKDILYLAIERNNRDIIAILMEAGMDSGNKYYRDNKQITLKDLVKELYGSDKKEKDEMLRLIDRKGIFKK